MEDLVKDFIDETIDSLSAIDIDLVKLENDPQNEELIGNVFRLMHNIKGTCGFIGLKRLENVSHSGESLMDEIRSGNMQVTEECITLILMSVDRVRFLVTEVEKDLKEPEGSDEDIISQINNYMEANVSDSGDVENKKSEQKALVSNPSETPEKTNQISVASNTTKEVSTDERSPEFLKVSMNVLEDLINMVSELVLTRNQLLQLVRTDENSPMKTPLHRLNRIVSDLQDSVMKTRMQPIGNAWLQLPRIVRDLKTELNKEICLSMSGEETELDRQVLTLIKDPLTHMIRNSCDHGIEDPETRMTLGKAPEGKIDLSAYHEGGFIIIKMKDDGKGLDHEKIGQKAIEKNLIDEDTLDKLSPNQILSLIMKPGFSTAEQVTSISGRGVGMDVVRSNIEKIGGSIDLESEINQGTTFTIKIPLTLAIISALIVEIENNRYAIPQMNIQELVSLDYVDSNMVEYINDKPVLRLRERIIPLLDNSTLFNKDFAQNGVKPQIKDNSLVVVINTGASHYGVIVDNVYDTEEVVIKSISSVLKTSEIYAGNTILGDGQVIMILDPSAISRHFDILVDLKSTAIQEQERLENQLSAEQVSMLIFSAGAGIYKTLPLAMVSRLHKFKAEEVTCSGNRMIVQYNQSLMQLTFIDPDHQTLNDKEVTCLILSDDRSDASVGLIIDEVIDIKEGEHKLDSSTKREGILGTILMDGQTLDTVDVAFFLTCNYSDWFSTNAHSALASIKDNRPGYNSSDDLQSLEAELEEEIQEIAQKVKKSTRKRKVTKLKANGNGANGVKSNGVSKASKPVEKPVFNGSKVNVLVVDDSAFFRTLLEPILITAGYQVTVCESATDAIQLHDEGKRFDIVLSDIEMPVMDGYEFIEKMREEQSNWKETPFIALTSHNRPQDIEYGYEKGFTKYVAKLDKKELIHTMSNIYN